MRLPWLTRALVRDVLTLEDAWERVALLADAQDGVVSREQGQLLGVSLKAIWRRCRSKHWFELFPGVFTPGRKDVAFRGRAIGALLICPPGSVLSHTTAAGHHGAIAAEGPIHVTTPFAINRGDGLTTHTSPLLGQDTRLYRGIPATRPARTALDCAETETRATLMRIVRELTVKGLTTREDLLSLIARSPGRHGPKALRAALADDASAPTRSKTERILRAALKQAGLPLPQSNYGLAGRERDFVWLNLKLILETDDFNTHGDRTSFEADRLRDAQAAALGFQTIRITRTQICTDTLHAIATLAAIIALRTQAAA